MSSPHPGSIPANFTPSQSGLRDDEFPTYEPGDPQTPLQQFSPFSPPPVAEHGFLSPHGAHIDASMHRPSRLLHTQSSGFSFSSTSEHIHYTSTPVLDVTPSSPARTPSEFPLPHSPFGRSPVLSFTPSQHALPPRPPMQSSQSLGITAPLHGSSAWTPRRDPMTSRGIHPPAPQAHRWTAPFLGLPPTDSWAANFAAPPPPAPPPPLLRSDPLEPRWNFPPNPLTPTDWSNAEAVWAARPNAVLSAPIPRNRAGTSGPSPSSSSWHSNVPPGFERNEHPNHGSRTYPSGLPTSIGVGSSSTIPTKRRAGSGAAVARPTGSSGVPFGRGGVPFASPGQGRARANTNADRDESPERKPWHPKAPSGGSSWVMWVGNVPNDATSEEAHAFFNDMSPSTRSLRGSFSSAPRHSASIASSSSSSPSISGPADDDSGVGAGAGVESIRLILQSHCAFVNYASEAHLQRALTFFNARPFRAGGVKLVCRVRRKAEEIKSGVGGQRGLGLHRRWVEEHVLGGRPLSSLHSHQTSTTPFPPSASSGAGGRARATSGAASVHPHTPIEIDDPPSGRDLPAVVADNPPAGAAAIRMPMQRTSSAARSAHYHGALDRYAEHLSQTPGEPPPKDSGRSSPSISSTTSTLLATYFPSRFFVLKSMTKSDLQLSVSVGLWATQEHNEFVLDQAYRTSQDVYLIFGANKAGEFHGYARMEGPILHPTETTFDLPPLRDDSSKTSLSPFETHLRKWDSKVQRSTTEEPGGAGQLDQALQEVKGEQEKSERHRWLQPGSGFRPSLAPSSSSSASVPSRVAESPFSESPASYSSGSGPGTKIGPPAVPTSSPSSQPALSPSTTKVESSEGSSGTLVSQGSTSQSGKASHETGTGSSQGIGSAEQNAADDPLQGQTPTKQWGTPFRVHWIAASPLPFHSTRMLRNPWNKDREVKVSRDGTELEPFVGQALVDLWRVGAEESVATTPVPSGSAGNTLFPFPHQPSPSLRPPPARASSGSHYNARLQFRPPP